MKIKRIVIELEPGNKDQDQPEKTLVFYNAKWSTTDKDGLFPGEIRLIKAIDDAKNSVGNQT